MFLFVACADPTVDPERSTEPPPAETDTATDPTDTRTGWDIDGFADTWDVLVRQCFGCHAVGGAAGLTVGPTAAATREDLLESVSSEGRPYVVPGDPDGSWIIQITRPGAEVRMPPEQWLPDEDWETLVAWVAAGAPR